MPSLGKMNVSRHYMGGGSKGTTFGKVFGGAVGAGYDNDQAAAMAFKRTGQYTGTEQRQRMAEAVRRLRESMFPHLRR